MAFNQTKGRVRVETCVSTAAGQTFKGALRVKIIRDDKQTQRITARGCGRSMRSFAAAMAIALTAREARRVSGFELS